MEQVFLIGTDIGTLGTKTAVFDSQGRMVASDYAEYGVLTPQPLWAEQWPDVWFDAVCRTIRGALDKSRVSPSQVAALTISSLYGGSGIPCDAEMRPLRPCIIWMDRRATDEVAWVREHIGEQRIFDITANYVDSYYGYTKILWIKNHEPEVWRRTRWLVTPNAYAIYRLTGQLSMDYCSAGNIGGIFDMHRRDWSTELLEAMGIPRHFFPETLVQSADVVGRVTREGAALTGLAEGTPVCAGGVDASVATLSAGAFDEGQHVAMMGTSMAWGVVHSGQRYNRQVISMPHVAHPRERVYSFAGGATAGAIVKWFREQFGQPEKLLGEMVHLDPYALLDMEASSVPPGSERLIVLPHFMGERAPIWNVNARGTIVGLTLYHTRAHLFRAFLEAVAYTLRLCIESGKNLGMKLDNRLVLVGGASKSELWKQIFAGVTGLPVVCVRDGGEATLGDALLGAVGTGVVPSYESIRSWIRFDSPVEAAPEVVTRYETYYRNYRNLYDALKAPMEDLVGLE